MTVKALFIKWEVQRRLFEGALICYASLVSDARPGEGSRVFSQRWIAAKSGLRVHWSTQIGEQIGITSKL
jgi:hypothetical protein